MANNRLYIGDKETKKTFCLTKSDGNVWRNVTERELDGLNELLSEDNIWDNETALILFSESDDFWVSYFFEK